MKKMIPSYLVPGVLEIVEELTKDNPMAEPEVEAAWRAEFKRSGATELHRAPNSDTTSADELKRRAAFRWLGDEAEARRLQQEKTHHYVRWALQVALAAVIAGLVAVGLAQLR